MTEPDYDSIRAAARLAQSSRLRSLLSWLGALLLPVVGAGAGWAAKSLETRSGYEQLLSANAELARKVDLLRADVAAGAGVERRVIQVGRQAAYATAVGLAYEAQRARKAKWASDYAASFERLVTGEGLSPEGAYNVLAKQVAPP